MIGCIDHESKHELNYLMDISGIIWQFCVSFIQLNVYNVGNVSAKSSIV